MKLPENVGGGSFEKCPPGNHLAVCYEVLDLGTQETSYGDKHQIWIGWETPAETMEDGRPFVIGKKYTFSSNEKATLRKDLESWRGKAFKDAEIAEFDVESIIGRGCFLNVVHNENDGRTYANVQTVAPLPKGTTAPPAVNEPTFLSLDPSEFKRDVYERLGDRMKETIAKSPEFQSLGQDAPTASTVTTGMPEPESDDDESPF